MKHNIVFKFIAIILCAASLAGAIGGITGVAVLASGDLYNKTVEQLIDQRIETAALNYADQVAREFAGRELGGCPEDLLDRYESSFWFDRKFPHYGYSILDENGSTLAAYNEELKDQVKDIYSIPVTGQYMHLVSTESEAEIAARETEALQSGSDAAFTIDSRLIADSVANVYDMQALFADGSDIRYAESGGPIGQIIYYAGNYVVFTSYDSRDFTSTMMTQPVTHFQCTSENGTILLQMRSPQGVGSFRLDDTGRTVFTSVTLDELTSSTPRNTEGILVDADGEMVPENGIAVHNVAFTRSDGSVIYRAYCYGGDGSYTFYNEDGSESPSFFSAGSAGFLFYNTEGRLVYHSALIENEQPSSSLVYGMHFHNIDQDFMFQIEDPNGLGTLTLEDGNLVFTSYASAPKEADPPEETVPETHPEETDPMEAPDETIVAATTPGEVPAEETRADETAATTGETVPSSASAVPEESAGAVEPAPAAPEAPEAPETPTTPVLSTEPIPVESIPEETAPAGTLPEATEPVMINGKRLEDYQINKFEYYDSQTSERMVASYIYVPMPELTVEMYIDRDAMPDMAIYDVLRCVRVYRDYLIPFTAICLFLFAVFAVYLCICAGRKPKCDEVKAGGLNRIPLDLYLFGGGIAIALLIVAAYELGDRLLQQNILLGCCFAAAAVFAACLVFVAFCFAFVAQIKTPDGFWWRNTLCGMCLRGTMKAALWLEHGMDSKGMPFLKKCWRKLWAFAKNATICLYKAAAAAFLWAKEKLGIAFGWLGKHVGHFIALLPLTWQWLLGGCAIIFISALCINDYNSPNVVILGLVLCLAIVLYAAHCFGVLSESTKRMGKGDLNTKVEDKLMIGCFEDFANDLSALADVAVVAAQKQLKSERMKTELITNVSHDIKTPLTSIINYVDLLQKPHTPEEQAQYLEVLDRQSQRLKKLIDDLMDMSKASTGNMPVEIGTVDVIESVNQALGEFADKLDKAQLIPMFRHTEDRVPILADGRLVWRVLSNLLSNAVKYAMPGTRLYIDLAAMEGKVVLSLKNISREELNVDADELMERFVRGDDSRNTEGSGLGLNIAKSLMELQKGQLQLLVDGDLFKVTLIFPGT